MDRSQSLNLDQRLSMRLSAQQLRFVRMLELTEPELEEAVDKELNDNPALEIDEDSPVEPDSLPRYRYEARNTSDEDPQAFDIAANAGDETLYDILLRQLDERDLPPHLFSVTRFIIGSIDANGYLRRPIPSLVNDMAFGPGIETSEEEVGKALDVIRQFEPYGVGATDLRDCLRIQLLHLHPSETRDDALAIIENQFEAFSMKHNHRIVSALKMSQERVKKAISLILSLNPKPGAAVGASADSMNVIVPDIVVDNADGQLTVAVNNRIPELRIDRTFSEAVKEMEEAGKRSRKKGMEFVTSRYNDARDFIRILRQRQETLVNVMTAILKIQHEYFATEDVYRLKPMMLKDIAALTGYDFSVISRATANKFVQTPWGIFPLRFFFSDSIGEESDDASEVLTNRKIEAEIEDIVNAEDKRHPLSDERIRQMMESRGYEVSRRTVAKYRDRKGIPVARLRKENF